MTRYRRELNEALTRYLKKVIELNKQFKMYSASAELRTAYHPQIQEEWTKETEIAKQGVEKAYNSYIERLDLKYTVNGSDINEKDVQLLNPAVFSLSQREFDKLQNKYSDNAAMIAALKNYAEVKGLILNERISFDKKAYVAEQARNSALKDISRNNLYELADWCVAMMGELYRETEQLSE